MKFPVSLMLDQSNSIWRKMPRIFVNSDIFVFNTFAWCISKCVNNLAMNE